MLIFLLLALHSLRCGMVWDGTGSVISDGRIVFRADRIEAIGPAGSLKPGADELDLRPLYCLPGLVDAHTHITSHVQTGPETDQRRHEASLRNARLTLEAGVTAVRDLGDSVSEGLWIRDAILAHRASGPRMQVACDQIGPDPMHKLLPPEQIRQLVGEHKARGCDVIKIFATEGIGGSERLLTREQIFAAVDEAHKLGLRVAAHVVGRAAIADCIAAGVDSVEHAPETDVALARKMASKKITLVPTLYILRYYIADAKNIGFSDDHVARLRALVEGAPIAPFEKRFRALLRTGVAVAAGSDSFLKLHGRNASELEWLVHAGMKPEQALRAMTRGAAQLMGWQDRVGSLEPGAYADVIAVERDPRKDITELERVKVVIQGGVVVKR